MTTDLREELAALDHARWAQWQAYLHNHCSIGQDGSLTIPAHLAEQWDAQAATPYALLSEAEKNSNRKQADRILSLGRARLPAPLVDLLHRLGATDTLWQGGLAKACEVAMARLSTEQADSDTHHLGELLAVIHRDGGHYQSQHGTAKASEDAQAVVSALRLALDAQGGPDVPIEPPLEDEEDLLAGILD